MPLLFLSSIVIVDAYP